MQVLLYFLAQDKVALVIVTSIYQMHGGPLLASKYDGREMSDILKKLGFKVSLKVQLPVIKCANSENYCLQGRIQDFP